MLVLGRLKTYCRTAAFKTFPCGEVGWDTLGEHTLGGVISQAFERFRESGNQKNYGKKRADILKSLSGLCDQ